MAITNLADVIAGLQPVRYFAKGSNLGNSGSNASQVGSFGSHWAIAGGEPVAGSYPGSLNGAALTYPETGALYWENAPSGKQAYLAKVSLLPVWTGNIGGVSYAMLADRLWHSGPVNLTSASAGTPQSITQPTLPPRDDNGSSDGDGVMLAMEWITTSTASTAAQSITASYTNSDGVSGRTATIAGPIVTAAFMRPSNFVYFGLQDDDVGVRSVQSVTVGVGWPSGTAGSAALVLFRPIVIIEAGKVNTPFVGDALSICLPKLWDNTCLFLLHRGNSSSSQGIQFSGQYQITFG